MSGLTWERVGITNQRSHWDDPVRQLVSGANLGFIRRPLEKNMSLITDHGIYNWGTLVCARWQMVDFPVPKTFQNKSGKTWQVDSKEKRPAIVFFFGHHLDFKMQTKSLDHAKRIAIGLTTAFQENPSRIIDLSEFLADSEVQDK